MINSRTFFILLYAVSLHICEGAFAATKIRFGFNPSNSEPLLFKFENENAPIATGGLIYEMAVAVGEDLHENYEVVRLPRKRMAKELSSGKTDLVCHNSVGWGHDFKDDVVWSNRLYTYSNVIVGTKEIPFISPTQIENVTIGTVENYFYINLENNFKAKKVIREDAISVPVSLKKLLAGRVDYVVMSDIEFSFYREMYPQLRRSSFLLSKTDIQCSLSKKSPLSLEKLNRTIDRLNKKKVFQNIYARYLDSHTIPRPFSYGLNGIDSPPFLFYDNSVSPPIVQGGIFFDIALEIGKRIHRPVKFELLPRGRLDARLAEGQVELVCYNTEVWAGSYAKLYNWSNPIFRQTNFIIGLKGDAVLHSLNGMKGKKVGTVLNFVYPAMIPYFENGSIIREDAPNGVANLEKLFMGRVPYIIMNNLEHNYYKTKYPKLQRASFDIDPVDVKCATSKKSDLKIDEINIAIREMKKTGRMQKIFFPDTIIR